MKNKHSFILQEFLKDMDRIRTIFNIVVLLISYTHGTQAYFEKFLRTSLKIIAI